MATGMRLFIPEARRRAARSRWVDAGGLRLDVPDSACLSRSTQETALAPPPGAYPAARGSETVLLVDDEPGILRLDGTVLSHYGYEVLLAADGEQAVDIYRRQGRRIALVILDVIMPQLTGGDVLRRLWHIDHGVRVLLTSGHPQALRTIVDVPGVCSVLAKPYRVQDLAAVVRAVLDRGRPECKAAARPDPGCAAGCQSP